MSGSNRPMSIFCRVFRFEDRRWEILRHSEPYNKDVWNLRSLAFKANENKCLSISESEDLYIICRFQNPNIPRASRAGRTGRQGGIGQDGTPTEQLPEDRRLSYPPRPRINVAWTLLQKHEQAKYYVKRWRNTTIGWRAIYVRFMSGTRSALCSWMLTSAPSPVCLCKFFSCKACPGILEIQINYKDKETSIHWCAARKNGVLRFANKPIIDRRYTGYQQVVNHVFFFLFKYLFENVGLSSISFVRAFEKMFRQLSSKLWKKRETIVFWSKQPVHASSCASPRRLTVCRPALARPVSPVVCSDFEFERFNTDGRSSIFRIWRSRIEQKFIDLRGSKIKDLHPRSSKPIIE